MIDLEFVERLIRAVDESGIDHVEIERGGTRVRISKSPQAAPATLSGNAVPAVPATAGVERSAVPASMSSEESVTGGNGDAGASVAENSFVDVPSPMVGTFYRSPTPESDPFIEVGERIAQGDTLCIIEAMKLMNELESEVDGVVREVLVENGEPVEYGQILFRVEPA